MALAAATALAPVILGAFHRSKKGPNRNAIIARYRASRPAGYVTPEDEAAAERTRTRLAGASAAAAQRARQMNARQVSARGLSGPAAAALEQGATDVEAQGSEDAARNSADQLYQAFQSNLGYERGKNDTAFGAEMGVASQDAALNAAKDSTFWNSMLEAIPAVAGGFATSSRSSAPTLGGGPTVSRSSLSGGGMHLPGAHRPPTAQPIGPYE